MINKNTSFSTNKNNFESQDYFVNEERITQIAQRGFWLLVSKYLDKEQIPMVHVKALHGYRFSKERSRIISSSKHCSTCNCEDEKGGKIQAYIRTYENKLSPNLLLTIAEEFTDVYLTFKDPIVDSLPTERDRLRDCFFNFLLEIIGIDYWQTN